MQRKIIHIDCDCYYAALEMRDFPELAGHPVAVSGTGARSVLSTCNYEARRYGLHSAMPTSQALKLCPHVILQPHRFHVYREVSQQIRDVFLKYTQAVEPLSLDEAYLDVTGSQYFNGSATLLAEHIRQEIKQVTGITVSAGIAPNKFLAKIASDWNKPDGSFTLAPADVDAFIRSLPVKKIHGVGAKMSERLEALGVAVCADLLPFSITELARMFGKQGVRLYELCRGIDERQVSNDRIRKSLSVEHTYAEDLEHEPACRQKIPGLFDELITRLADKEHPDIRSLLVKVKYSDFRQTTVERCLPLTPESFESLIGYAMSDASRPVRLLGVGVRFREQNESQLDLF